MIVLIILLGCELMSSNFTMSELMCFTVVASSARYFPPGPVSLGPWYSFIFTGIWVLYRPHSPPHGDFSYDRLCCLCSLVVRIIESRPAPPRTCGSFVGRPMDLDYGVGADR